MQPLLHAVLGSDTLWLIARILLSVVFLASGLAKLIDFHGGRAEMRAAGLKPDWLFNLFTAVTLLTGAGLILLDRAVWLGAGALAVFLVLTIVVVHRFWALRGPQAKQALYWALEHASLIGGLIAAAMVSHDRIRLPA